MSTLLPPGARFSYVKGDNFDHKMWYHSVSSKYVTSVIFIKLYDITSISYLCEIYVSLSITFDMTRFYHCQIMWPLQPVISCDINRKMAFMIGMRDEINGHGSLKLENQSQKYVTEKEELNNGKIVVYCAGRDLCTNLFILHWGQLRHYFTAPHNGSSA